MIGCELIHLHCILATCDFENDRCTWTNTRMEDDFDWIIGKGYTPSGSTGPNADHTKQTGDGEWPFVI